MSGTRVFKPGMLKGAARNAATIGAMATALSLLAASGALASTVTVSGGNTVRVGETGNEVNRVTVSYEAGPNRFRIVDSSANLAPSDSCLAVDAHSATCPGTGIKTVSVTTDDQNDTIALDASVPSSVAGNLDGGSGNDAVSGHGSVNGGSGNDTVIGSPLADTIRGGSGRDTVDGRNGPDDIAGGSGTDTLVYAADRATPVNVTVGDGNGNDGGAEDQGSSRRDTVHGDLEVVIGTALSDLIVGDWSSETLVGGAGDDTLIGNNGGDRLLGLEGSDLILGGNGGDVLKGWLGADRLFGGRDRDKVVGGPDGDLVVGNKGRDVLKGKSGIDRLRAKDHYRDRKISCGAGANGLEGAKRDKHLDPKPRSC
jgi:Ca2+-binding RTX toxin-like protein